MLTSNTKLLVASDLLMMLTTFVANYSLIIAIAKIRFFLKLVKKYLVCASRIRQKVGGKGIPLAYNYKRIEREEERSGERREC